MLQNKQWALGEAGGFLLKRESWGRLRKLGGRSTLLGKILFNIIWMRPLVLTARTHNAATVSNTHAYARCSSFLPTEEWGKGWTVAAAHSHDIVVSALWMKKKKQLTNTVNVGTGTRTVWRFLGHTWCLRQIQKCQLHNPYQTLSCWKSVQTQRKWLCKDSTELSVNRLSDKNGPHCSCIIDMYEDGPNPFPITVQKWRLKKPDRGLFAQMTPFKDGVNTRGTE